MRRGSRDVKGARVSRIVAAAGEQAAAASMCMSCCGRAGPSRARGARGRPLAGWGAYGRGGGEVQVAAALALVSACLAHRQVMRRMLGGSGSGVVGWGKWAPS